MSVLCMVGVGVTLAVLMDATLVRLLLMPAVMRLLGCANWWAPRPLVWLHRHFGLSESRELPERPPVKAPAPVNPVSA